MINLELPANQAVNVPFYHVTNGLNLGDFSVTVLKDGLADSTVPLFSEPVGNHYNFAFTFSAPGIYAMFINGTQIASVRIVEKDKYDMLQDIEDVALGSWQWDKANGSLIFLRQNGDTFATFDVVEDSAIASRELI